MGSRGPAPKPTRLKALEGNPGKRPLNENEPKPILGVPSCPAHMSKEGRAEWKRVVPELYNLGLLALIDRAALVQYCEAWSEYVECKEVIAKKGRTFKTPSGYIAQRPEVGNMHKAIAITRAFCHEFGLTPSARGKLSGGSNADQSDDILD